MKNSDFGRVCVFYGGTSNEREISLESGQNIYNGLKNLAIESMYFDPKHQSLTSLLELKPDRIFNILHGDPGEDGRYQAFFDLHQIPYTGSGMEASVICLNKLICKTIWQKQGIPTPDFLVIEKEDLRNLGVYQKSCQTLGLPLIIKPANEGSSLGISIVNDFNDWQQAVELASKYRGLILAEKYIQGNEYTFGVIGDQVLPGVLIKCFGEFYDYIAKYQDHRTELICPCDLTQKQENEYLRLALKAARVLNCRGWYRVDLIIDQQHEPYLLEINTAPGMTSHSLIPKAAREFGWDYEQTLIKILENSRFDQVY